MIAPLPERKPKKDIKLMQRLYKQYRLSGMCIYDSAIKAGYSHTMARAQGKRLDKVGNIRATLEVMGVSDESVVNTLKDCLVAERPVVCDKEISMVPDHAIRHKTAETVLKLKRYLGDSEQTAQGVTAIQVNFNLTEAKDAETIELKAQPIEISEGAQLPSESETIIGFEGFERPKDT